MCYVCNCLIWSVEAIQRLITFCMSSLLLFIVCFGLTVSILAGVAYGYNFSMVEFITFTRSDATVYIRRGRLRDEPDLPNLRDARRMDGGLPDGSSEIGGNLETGDDVMNASIDYQDKAPSAGGAKPLPKTILLKKDSRKYGQSVAQYTGELLKNSNDNISDQLAQNAKQSTQSSVVYYSFTTPPVEKISILSNRMLTTIWETGSSTIIMRKYPGADSRDEPLRRSDTEDYFYRAEHSDAIDKLKSKFKLSKGSKSQDSQEEIHTRQSIPINQYKGDSMEADDEDIPHKPV